MTTFTRVFTRPGAFALAALLSGCFTYQTVETPPPGADVRAVLTTEGAVVQSELFGEPIRSLSGKMVSTDAETVRLDVITGQSRGNFNDIILRDTLSVPRAHIVEMEQRDVAWVRTALIGAGVVGVAIFGIASATNGSGGNGGDGPAPPTSDVIRIPFFSWSR